MKPIILNVNVKIILNGLLICVFTIYDFFNILTENLTFIRLIRPSPLGIFYILKYGLMSPCKL